MRKWVFSILLPMLAVVSCGPLIYTLPVEKRVQSDANVDFAGALPVFFRTAVRIPRLCPLWYAAWPRDWK